MNQSHTSEFLRRIREGDEPAFEQIVLSLEKSLYHYLYRVVGERETAEDLTQETFLKVYQQRKKIDPSGNLKAWIFTIATNLARDWYRVQGKRRGLTFALPEEDRWPDETLAADDTYKLIEAEFVRAELDAALAELLPLYRTVVILHYYEEQQYDTIALILHIPENTVKTRIRRAKAALREIIHKHRSATDH